MHPLVRDYRDDILRLAREHGARNVRLFGSAARGEDRAESDLDLLVDMEEGRSLVDHAALKLPSVPIPGASSSETTARTVRKK